MAPIITTEPVEPGLSLRLRVAHAAAIRSGRLTPGADVRRVTKNPAVADLIAAAEARLREKDPELPPLEAESVKFTDGDPAGSLAIRFREASPVKSSPQPPVVPPLRTPPPRPPTARPLPDPYRWCSGGIERITESMEELEPTQGIRPTAQHAARLRRLADRLVRLAELADPA